MRALFYGLSTLGLALFSLGMALLARYAPTWWLFGLAGAVMSAGLSGAWLALSATAGDWPRPRAGHALAGAGLLVTAVNLWSGLRWPAAWSALVLVAGVILILPIWPNRRRKRAGGGGRGPVRPPLGRRESL